jgi:hypothetical protein
MSFLEKRKELAIREKELDQKKASKTPLNKIDQQGIRLFKK